MDVAAFQHRNQGSKYIYLTSQYWEYHQQPSAMCMTKEIATNKISKGQAPFLFLLSTRATSSSIGKIAS
jgi:hypothetical protein